MKTRAKDGAPNLKRHLDESAALARRFFGNSMSYERGFITWQDMVSFAEEHGVVCVVKKKLSLSALSMPIGDQWAILIKEGESAERQRFSLAHEIAHLFMTPELQRQIWQATPLGAGDTARKNIEKFCDDLAARILLPEPLLSIDLAGKNLAPDLLVDLAWKYGVSVQAFSIRAVEMQKSGHHVAKWHTVNDQKGRPYLRREWRAAARGLKDLMPETTTMRSPVGQLFERCMRTSAASYSGEILRNTKRENVVMQGSLLRQGTCPAVLAVTRKADTERAAPP